MSAQPLAPVKSVLSVPPQLSQASRHAVKWRDPGGRIWDIIARVQRPFALSPARNAGLFRLDRLLRQSEMLPWAVRE
jgi:hypothetical protein